MAHHPRIGERPDDGRHRGSMSRSEQAGVDPADAERRRGPGQGEPGVRGKVRPGLPDPGRRTHCAGNPRRPWNQRLSNSPEEEDTIVAQQLREIAVLRLAA